MLIIKTGRIQVDGLGIILVHVPHCQQIVFIGRVGEGQHFGIVLSALFVAEGGQQLIHGVSQLVRVHARQLLLGCLGRLGGRLLLDQILIAFLYLFVRHIGKIGIDILFRHAQLLGIGAFKLHLHLIDGNALHSCIDRLLYLIVGGDAHDLGVSCRLFFAVHGFHRFGKGCGLLLVVQSIAVREGMACQDIRIGAVLLGLRRLGFFALLDHIGLQGFGIADGSAQHVGDRVLIGTDDAADLQFQSLIVQILQAGIGRTSVLPQSGGIIVAIAVSRR